MAIREAAAAAVAATASWKRGKVLLGNWSPNQKGRKRLLHRMQLKPHEGKWSEPINPRALAHCHWCLPACSLNASLPGWQIDSAHQPTNISFSLTLVPGCCCCCCWVARIRRCRCWDEGNEEVEEDWNHSGERHTHTQTVAAVSEWAIFLFPLHTTVARRFTSWIAEKRQRKEAKRILLVG